MSSKLSMGVAADVLKGSFLPLQGHVRAADHGTRVVLSVSSASETIVADQELTRQQVTDPRRLQAIIHQLRAFLEQQGHRLSPWSFPNGQ